MVTEVAALLFDRAARATEAGVAEVWIDPGIGFGKTVDHNLALLAALADLVDTGYPVLVGTSRKSFLGALGPTGRGRPVPVDERLPGSLATATWAMAQGAEDGAGPRRRRHRPGRRAGGAVDRGPTW